MHVAVGFMPAFKYRQKNFLVVLAGDASRIPTGGRRYS